MNTYDIAIIGSGPGGYVAAIRASQLGLKAAVIEKDRLGGVCLNMGCIPSKSLIHQASQFGAIEDLEAMGLKVDASGLDYGKVFDKSRKAADTLSRGVAFLMKKNKVDVILGEAKFKDASTLIIDGKDEVGAKNIIIATGSRPVELPGFAFDEDAVMSSDGALMLKKLPKSIIVLGSGAIGMEFSYIFSSFGVEVHLVEMLGRIMPIEDEEISAHMQRVFKKKGVKIYTSAAATSMEKTAGGVKVKLAGKDGKEIGFEAEKLLVAVGRRPNTEKFGLDAIGVKLDDKGFVDVGDYYETNIKGVYAIGDVVRSPLLAHVASKEGEIAVEHIAGRAVEKRIDPSLIPLATYCEPQVGSFGLTEWRAKQDGIPYKTASFTYRAAGKAVAVEQIEGFVKLVFNPDTREILGAHIMGAEATELIHEVLLARKAELVPEDIATMIHAHPTLSETVMESARAAEGWMIHA